MHVGRHCIGGFCFEVRFLGLAYIIHYTSEIFPNLSGVREIQVPHIAIRYSPNLVSLAIRSAVIVGDVLVLLVTWSKTASLYRESRRLGIKAPLATLLFRDGELIIILESMPPLYAQVHV